MELEARKAVLYSIFDAGVRAVAPDAALMRHVCLEDGQLLVDGQSWKLPRRGRLLVLGAGKGVAPMGAAVEELLGDRIDTGMLVVKYGHGLPLQQIAQVEAAHPVPDAAGAAATRALLELAAGAAADDLVLCLLTGGASALTPAPVSGVTLEDMQQVTELLLRSGATITELNAVRKHLSRFSGGQLARTAAPAGVVSVIVSDVVGDALDVIASGPTAPDVSTFADCMDILARYGLGSAMPPAVLHHLRQGQLHQEAETPKPGDALFRHVQNTLVATNRQALDAAAEQARSHGFRPVILTDRMVGEAREQAALLVTQARQMAAELAADAQPVCLLAGGETTVTLRGRGRGGTQSGNGAGGQPGPAGLPAYLRPVRRYGWYGWAHGCRRRLCLGRQPGRCGAGAGAPCSGRKRQLRDPASLRRPAAYRPHTDQCHGSGHFAGLAGKYTLKVFSLMP